MEHTTNLNEIAKKWQKRWEESGIFKVKEDSKKPKYTVVEMYPYPSASYLHMGHVRNYTIGDAIARFKRMMGFNVLYPMGYDSFGLPAENAAKKEGIHPKIYTEKAIAKIMEFQKALGNSYDWSRVIASHQPEYYKWNQWFFLKFLEKGLVYRKKAPVNWCTKCSSTLANEEVVNGHCWRHEDTEVEQKELEQWFLKITDYADELLKDLDKLGWSDRIKNLQRNWIGKSEGVMIDFPIKGSKNKLTVFTTRPDTIHGVTFVTVSPKHKLIGELAKINHKQLEEFSRKVQSDEEKEKEGLFLGSYVINPFTNEEVPVYAANFVVAEYGTGAVMAVPAHDQRDFDFAKKYKLPIKQVIAPHFTTGGEDSPKEGKKVVKREMIYAILRNPKTDEFLCLDWPKFKWHAFVIGGIDGNEDSVQAAKRELKEETGYANVKFVKDLGYISAAYFATHKDENRESVAHALAFELIDEKRVETKEEHTKDHKTLWLKRADVSKFLNFQSQQHAWAKYLGDSAYTGEGVLVKSGQFNGLNSNVAIDKISEYAEKKKFGKRITQFKIRDWLISRQRYWGTPIPVIYCNKCGIVPEKNLPLLLPEKVDFHTTGNPLLRAKEWIHVKCPNCKSPAERETDTMGGFVDSSWYFLRYCSPKDNKGAFDKKAVDYWMSVDQYVGGIEHAVGHLIYSRFWTKALRDLGLVTIDEPFKRLFNQGIVYKDGHKMSKSFGNVVYQTDISEKHGIDTARLFLMFVADPESDMEWNDSGVEGSHRFLQKIARIVNSKFNKPTERDEHKRNSAIKKYTELIEKFKFNLAIVELMKYSDYVSEHPTKEGYGDLIKMISPFTPHLAEEMWEKLGNKGFVSLEKWPKVDEKKISQDLELSDSLLESTKSDIRDILKLAKVETPKKITLFVSEGWKYELYKVVLEEMKKTRNVSDIMKKVMGTDLKKHGQDVQKMLPRLVSNPPEFILDKEKEHKALKESETYFGKEFNTKVQVIKAEESNAPKAKSASPGRPAILVE